MFPLGWTSKIIAMDESDSSELYLDTPTSLALDSLPDDALRLIYKHYHAAATSLSELSAFFMCNRRLNFLAALFVDVLELTVPSASQLGMLSAPMVRTGHNRVRRHMSLLAPYAWAARLRSLRALEINHIGWPGASRLLSLLPAWPHLEQLELRFDYDYRDATSMRTVVDSGQDLVDDLAATLLMGHLPKLQYLWLGSVDCEHCFGQRFDHGTLAERGALTVDDGELLEQLQPTAALWWMAERAKYVRDAMQ